MAISKIKPRHASEGRSIAAVLKDRIDYDKNPDKTKGGLLVSSYQCGADTAWQEFALSKQIYEAETGRKRAPENDVISYLIIQSFKPGEIFQRTRTSWGISWLWSLPAGNTNSLLLPMWISAISTVISNLTAPPWTALINSTTTEIPIRRSEKSMTDCVGNTACL